MSGLGDIFARATNPRDYVVGARDRLAALVAGMDVDATSQLIDALERANERDATVFVLGNGGSGAVAAHWVTDLGVNTLVPDQPGYRVVSLGDSPSSITAIGNDFDFSDVFITQLRAGLRPDDVVIALSVSGNSLNVIRAIEYANEVGAVTVGMTGIDGGKLKDLANISIHTESTNDEYGPIEDMFSVLMHVVTGYIAQRRGRVLHH